MSITKYHRHQWTSIEFIYFTCSLKWCLSTPVLPTLPVQTTDISYIQTRMHYLQPMVTYSSFIRTHWQLCHVRYIQRTNALCRDCQLLLPISPYARFVCSLIAAYFGGVSNSFLWIWLVFRPYSIVRQPGVYFISHSYYMGWFIDGETKAHNTDSLSSFCFRYN